MNSREREYEFTRVVQNRRSIVTRRLYAARHDRLPAEGTRRLTITTIVCAYNEARYLPACLHSLLAQTRPADEIVVVNNASSDDTGAVARAIPGVRVIDEPVKGLVIAREYAAGLSAVLGIPAFAFHDLLRRDYPAS